MHGEHNSALSQIQSMGGSSPRARGAHFLNSKFHTTSSEIQSVSRKLILNDGNSGDLLTTTGARAVVRIREAWGVLTELLLLRLGPGYRVSSTIVTGTRISPPGSKCRTTVSWFQSIRGSVLQASGIVTT